MTLTPLKYNWPWSWSKGPSSRAATRRTTGRSPAPNSTPLPGGRTRLEGTTWYHHTMWPEPYWKLWSDGIIRRIHLQVLRHVKRLAESA
jgi:hypothetical protein